MKNFNFNLLQYLNNKKAEKGFTLIELLVVIIIIGILSAIALPAFLNQANKARQSEAKQAIGATNRGQQAYYLEKQEFAQKINDLGLGLNVATKNYSYGAANTQAQIGANTGNVFSPAGLIASNKFKANGTVFAVAGNQEAVRDYAGAAFVTAATATAEATTTAVLCEEADLAKTPTNITGGAVAALAITKGNMTLSYSAVGAGTGVACASTDGNSQEVAQ